MPALRLRPVAAAAVGEDGVARKVHEVISILEAHGWQQVRVRGSHRQFRHGTNPAVLTATGKRSVNIPIGQLASIRRKSGIEDLR
jgi:predicted RNA binding protein YcfA (HicA-like mRNA interferase family)